ncbi:MAG: hypothetical protein Q4E22_00975, partial [Coriobacteriia bacterium]|nr:hypothetical protein [Coriobacteriia bacterium]
IGSGSMPKEFDSQLIGMKPGEEKEFDFKSDDTEDDAPSLHVKVKVLSHKNRVLPELNDEFAKERFGFDSLEKMHESIKGEIEGQKALMFGEMKEQKAIHALGKRVEGDIPENYTNIVFNDLGSQFLTSLQQQGLTLDQYLGERGLASEQFVEDLRKQADDVARESLALDALARHEKFEVSKEDILRELAASNPEGADEAYKEFSETGRIPSIKDYIRRSKAIEFLVENAKTTEVDFAAQAQEEAKGKKKTSAKKATKSASSKSEDKKEAEKVEEKEAAEEKKTAKKAPAKKSASKEKAEKEADSDKE